MFKMGTVFFWQIANRYHPALLTFCNISGVICLISCVIRYLRSSILLGFSHKIRQIPPEMLQNVRHACYHRFAICQERNGTHFEHFVALNSIQLIKLVFIF
jgi:hypothetical protein